MPTEGEERAEFLRRLAAARALPSIVELERLWYEMVREMTDAGKVVKFRAPSRRSTTRTLRKTRARPPSKGTSCASVRSRSSSNGEYLGYLPSQKSLTELNGELIGEFQTIGRNLQSAPPGQRLSAGRRRPGERPAARASTSSGQTGSGASRRARSSATSSSPSASSACCSRCSRPSIWSLTRLAVSAQLQEPERVRARTTRSAACCSRSAATASASRTPSSPSCGSRRPCCARFRVSNASSRSCGWPSRPVRCSASSAPSSA